MRFKKTVGFLTAAVLVFGLAIGASAAMWVGPEFGPSFNSPIDVKVSGPKLNNTVYGMQARTGYASGIMMGYDFVNYGAGAYAYPEWMKYFGVAMGVSYNPLYFTSQTRSLANGGFVSAPSIDGSNVALTFLAIGKLPLCVSDEYKGGRFAPYVGVGPGVVFTNMDFNKFGGNSQTSTNVGLVTEAGLRYFVTPNFSADVAYRYRYNVPSFNVGPANNVTLTGSQNTSQVLCRMAIQF